MRNGELGHLGYVGSDFSVSAPLLSLLSVYHECPSGVSTPWSKPTARKGPVIISYRHGQKAESLSWWRLCGLFNVGKPFSHETEKEGVVEVYEGGR